MSRQHSFIATLHVNDLPVHCLGEFTCGDVVVARPGSAPQEAIAANRALGYLSTDEKDFTHGNDLGLITFDLATTPQPLPLYFRYYPEGYRVYVRGGMHAGKGVFHNHSGLVTLEKIVHADPSLWHLTHRSSGKRVDLTRDVDDRFDVKLAPADCERSLCNQGLFPVGGYLSCQTAGKAAGYRLDVLQRNVDWARRG